MSDKKQIFEILKNKFPVADCELNFNNNYELIVAVILSAQCTDKRVNIVTPNLFKKYPTVKDLANANEQELKNIIHSCGFYNNKSKNLIAMAKDVCQKFGGEIPSDYDDLISLSGVGRKTANVVMAVGFGKDAIAVDTHVFRVSNRLGIKSKNPLECEKQLQKIFDQKDWSHLHYLLVLFGRYYCKAIKPECSNCELKEFCILNKNLQKKWRKIAKNSCFL